MPLESSKETTPKGPVDARGNQVFALGKMGSVSISFNKSTEGFEPWVEWGMIRQGLGSPQRVTQPPSFPKLFAEEPDVTSRWWLNCDFGFVH